MVVGNPSASALSSFSVGIRTPMSGVQPKSDAWRLLIFAATSKPW